jgi:hypothetical protein
MGRLRALLFLPFLICASAQAQGPQGPQGPTPLQLSTPVEKTLAPNETHEFTVTLQENAWIQLVVEQQGIDVVVRPFSPDGRSLGEFDSPNGADGPEHVSFVSAAAGNYRIAVSPLDPAGTTSGRYLIKILELRQATDEEIKASQNPQVVKAKGVALLLELEQAITEIQSPFTRINYQLLAAQLLSEPEPKRASKYLTDAANGMKELIASVDASDPDYSQRFASISQLRFEMTRILAQRDPEAALNFLYSTVPPPNPYSNKYEQTSQESMMELSLANQIMQNDPNRALQIARKNLKTRLSSNLMATLSILSRKAPELAAELANEIADKVLQENLLKNPEAGNVAVGLLVNGMRPERRFTASNYGQPKSGALLTDAHYRDLLQKAMTEALSYRQASSQSYTPERNAAATLLRGLQGLGPVVLDTVTPGGGAAVDKKLNEVNDQRASGPYQSQYAIANNPVDTALETIAKAPQEQREQLYLQLANREANSGDSSRARQITNERISNYAQRRSLLMNIDQQEIYRALGKGKVDEALRIISGFRIPRERAAQLAQIANQIGPGQKRANAINLLEQARAMLGPSLQAPDQDHMNALLEIARAFDRYDSKRSFEIVDPLIDQINEICTAARTMEGFGAQNFDDEELNLQNGGSVAQAVNRMSQALGTLAVTNFERAKADADRLRLPEVRLKAYLDIAQHSISGPTR